MCNSHNQRNKPTMNKLYDELSGIPNNNRDLGIFLYGLVFTTRPKVVVELGTWHGYTAICMAKAMQFWGKKKGGKYKPMLFTVDNYEHVTMEQVDLNIGKHDLMQYIYNVSGDTGELGKQFEYDPIDLLFMDASHTYEGLEREHSVWFPHLAKGALVLIHDYHHPNGEVAAWVQEFAVREKQAYTLLETTDGLGLVMIRMRN